jgi:site-specific DNA-methyltransferase (adenine-specific)
MPTIFTGDAREVLQDLDEGSVSTCVTSPPYFGLRDYGHSGQIGLEHTPDAFVQELVTVFREVRRVLSDDGTLWLNLGDSYNAYNANRGASTSISDGTVGRDHPTHKKGLTTPTLKNKDLIGIPWRVAFALQADGWYLRQDIIWHKPNPMPESVRDRCTKAHEYVFLFSKSPRYYFDSEAMQEDAVKSAAGSTFNKGKTAVHQEDRSSNKERQESDKRNRRSVWTVATRPFKGAHFATFPPDLIEPCILAGCPEGGIVLDPFFGAGTTGLVAAQHKRDYIGIELNPEYVELAKKRLESTKAAPLSPTPYPFA